MDFDYDAICCSKLLVCMYLFEIFFFLFSNDCEDFVVIIKVLIIET